jgi:dephospho-CoA kinase
MTKIIGLTGGIGSGKTIVANLFRKNGVPVYIADEQAKEILDKPETIALVIEAFGSEILDGNKIDRKKLAAIVFDNPEKLQRLNNIIHPAVKKHFIEWVQNNGDQPIVVKEAAILFESGTNVDCDAVIAVTAPLEIRIERVMKRDKISRDDVLNRVENQWDESKKAALSDYVITNIEPSETERQFNEILKKLHNI